MLCNTHLDPDPDGIYRRLKLFGSFDGRHLPVMGLGCFLIGSAIVGNFGSHTKFDYTMLGDAVNLAARLEGVNKQFGTYTMISEFTRKEIGDDFAFREIGRVAVVGRKQAVLVFEPLRPEVRSARKEILNAFTKGLALFYAGEFTQAKAIFDANSDDPPSRAYGAKCAGLLKNPPPDWAGVWVMTEK